MILHQQHPIESIISFKNILYNISKSEVYAMYDELFSQRLTELRQQIGVSARDMSLSLGQNPGYINNIENKNNLPSMTVFFYICEYLDITPQEFFDFEVHMPNEMNILIENSKKLNKDDFSHISAIVKSLAHKK